MKSDACRGCHADVYAAWRGSHHDLAMQPAEASSVLGDFGDVRFRQRDAVWRFFRRDAAFYVHTAGPDGVRGDFRVAYTFGVDPLQMYLVALPGGRLQALTVAWDTRARARGGQRWFSLHPDADTPPGDVLHWSGAGNRWNSMCAHCHSTNLRKNFSVARGSYETTWSEVDVACEACHGPASEHVAWAAAGALPSEASGLVRDLDRGETRWVMDAESGIARREAAHAPSAELESCAGCHSRRSLLDEDPEPERYLDRFRPALLEEGLYFADGQIRDEVYVYGSFLQSRMHAAGVTCSDCHDPHALSLRAEGDALCAQCHAPSRFAAGSHHHHPEGSAGSRCVSCHMPARTYMQVDARRDHSFRVPRPDLSVDLGVPNACDTCHAERGAAWAAEAVASWYPDGRSKADHFGRQLHAARAGGRDAGPALLALAGDAGVPPIARATAVEMLATHPLRGTQAGEVIAAAARDAEPLLRAAAARASGSLPDASRAARVGALLEDAVASVRIEAARALADLPAVALTAEQHSARARALREYRASQALHADEPSAHVNLGLLERALGEPRRAERAYRRAIAVGAYFAPAYVNLADLYREQGRDVEAEEVLRQGLLAAPEVPELHHSLGLTLVRLGRSKEALGPLRRAHERGENARFAYVYAVALHAAGQTDQGITTLEAARQRHPHEVSLLEALVALTREAGRAAESAAYARELEAKGSGS